MPGERQKLRGPGRTHLSSPRGHVTTPLTGSFAEPLPLVGLWVSLDAKEGRENHGNRE